MVEDPQKPVDPERVKRDVAELKQQGAPDADIDAYLFKTYGLKPTGVPSHVEGGAGPGLPESRPAKPYGIKDWLGLGAAGIEGAGAGYGAQIAGAGAEALTRQPGTYQMVRDAIKKASAETARDRPVAHTLAEGVGGLAPALATGGGALAEDAPWLLRQLAKGPVQAAAYGGVAGSSDTEKSASERAAGAGLGVATGLGGYGLLSGAGKVASGAADLLNARPTRGTLTGKIAEAIGMRTPEDIGDQTLLSSMRERGSVPDVKKSIVKMSTDKPLSFLEAQPELMDVARGAQGVKGGTSRRALAGMAEQREGATAPRVSQDLGRATALGEGQITDELHRGRMPGADMGLAHPVTPAAPNVPQIIADLDKRQSEDANRMYRLAEAHGMVDDPEINDILKLPFFSGALEGAGTAARLEGGKLPTVIDKKPVVDLPGLTGNEPPSVFGSRFAGGRPEVPTKDVERTVPDVKALNYIKKSVNKTTAPLGSGQDNVNPIFHPLSEANDKMVGRARELVPELGDAIDQFKRTATQKDAIEAGQKLAHGDPNAARVAMEGLDAEAQPFFRLGMLYGKQSAIRETGGGTSALSAVHGTQSQAESNALLHNTARVPSLAKRLGEESRMAETNQGLLGKNASEAGLPDNTAVHVPVWSVPRALGGNPGYLLAALAKLKLGSGLKALDTQVSNQVGNRLAKTGPKTLITELEDMITRERAIRAKQGVRRAGKVALSIPAAIDENQP